MKYTSILISSLISLSATLVCAQGVVVKYEGPLEWVETGGTHAHTFVIQNQSPHAVVLLSLNEHRFSPPNFEHLCGMKSPRPNWAAWRNVLLPSQQTRVVFPATRHARGVSLLKTTLTYAKTGQIQPPWVSRVVGGTVGEGEVAGCLLNASDEYYVAYPDGQLSLVPLTREDTWTYKVKGEPRLERLGLYILGMESFSLDVPYFGDVVWKDGRAYQLKQDAMGAGDSDGELSIDRISHPLGHVDMKALHRLGRDLNSGDMVKMHSVNAETLKRVGLAPVKSAQNYVASTAESELSHASVLFQGVLKADDLSRFWAALKASGSRLSVVPHYGLVIRSETDVRLE